MFERKIVLFVLYSGCVCSYERREKEFFFFFN